MLLLFALTPAQGSYQPSPITRIIFLGTGNPNPDPAHQGPSTVIVVKDQTYIIDAGPGVVRQAVAAGLKVKSLTRVFITHLHSDHTMGLPDLMFTPAVTGREKGLDIYGPPGTGRMITNIQRAWAEDRDIRFYGGEPSVRSAYRFTVHELHPDEVYRDDNVKVSAFLVCHGKWNYAYGYRFETPDRTIVISGDTTYCPNLVRNARRCDILIHEVYSAEGLKLRTPDWIAYHSAYHTSAPDLARIASAVKPKLLLLYHELPFREPMDEILKEVRLGYAGDVREAQDLASY